MATQWALVGRQRELARVAEAMERGDGGVLLSGPAGVGKTRLALECLDLAAARGYATARVRANRSAATIPYGAFAPLLPVSGRAAEGRAEVLRQATEAIVAAADGEPLMLLVDDAHDLDEASAALLLQLVVSGQLFALVTVRSNEPAPDPVVMLWKDELLTRIDVPPLSAKDVGRLMAAVLGGPVDGSTVQAFWVASEGNALFLRELILSGTESSRLSEQQGIWRLRGTPEPSPRLAELVELRLGALDDADRAVLEVVSVGEPVGLAELERSASRDQIERLERRGLVEVLVEDRRRQVRMAHPLYGEVVRGSLPAARRARICRDLADAIVAAGARRREDALRVAVWQLEGGGATNPQVLLVAALRASFAFDYPLVERLARAAWDAGAGAEAGHLLGETLDTLGDHEQAEEVLREAEARVRDDKQRSLVAQARASNLFRGLGRAEEAEAVARAAEAQLTDPDQRDEMLGHRAVTTLLAGNLDEALRLAQPLLDRADDRAFAHGGLAAGTALALAGRTDEAIDVSDRAFAARIALGDQVQIAGPGVYLVARALALSEAGRLDEAEATAQAGYDGAVEAQVLNGQGWFTVVLGRICLLQGRAAAAARWFREAAVLWGELVHPATRWGFGGLAHALALSGEFEGADAALSDLDAEPPTPMQIMDVDIDRARAWYMVLRGEHARAAAMLRDAAKSGIARGQHALAAGALHDFARLGDTTVADELAAVAERVDGQLMPARLAHATALAKGDADALDDASEAFEAIGALLFAAEAAAAAAGIHEATGMRRKASASTQRATSLTARCEGARTPVLGATAEPAALTRREREVATLAARGMSSRDIATTLVVSTRTVENHLQRAYEKLGVSSRADLADVLGVDA
ncbi:MAG: ATP-binding protein [Actinomycetota bacterium]